MDANQVLSRYAQADLKLISLRTNLRGAKMPDGRMAQRSLKFCQVI